MKFRTKLKVAFHTSVHHPGNMCLFWVNKSVQIVDGSVIPTLN